MPSILAHQGQGIGVVILEQTFEFIIVRHARPVDEQIIAIRLEKARGDLHEGHGRLHAHLLGRGVGVSTPPLRG